MFSILLVNCQQDAREMELGHPISNLLKGLKNNIERIHIVQEIREWNHPMFYTNWIDSTGKPLQNTTNVVKCLISDQDCYISEKYGQISTEKPPTSENFNLIAPKYLKEFPFTCLLPSIAKTIQEDSKLRNVRLYSQKDEYNEDSMNDVRALTQRGRWLVVGDYDAIKKLFISDTNPIDNQNVIFLKDLISGQTNTPVIKNQIWISCFEFCGINVYPMTIPCHIQPFKNGDDDWLMLASNHWNFILDEIEYATEGRSNEKSEAESDKMKDVISLVGMRQTIAPFINPHGIWMSSGKGNLPYFGPNKHATVVFCCNDNYTVVYTEITKDIQQIDIDKCWKMVSDKEGIFEDPVLIYEGYWCDVRNARNAWIETKVLLVMLSITLEFDEWFPKNLMEEELEKIISHVCSEPEELESLQDDSEENEAITLESMLINE